MTTRQEALDVLDAQANVFTKAIVQHEATCGHCQQWRGLEVLMRDMADFADQIERRMGGESDDA